MTRGWSVRERERETETDSERERERERERETDRQTEKFEVTGLILLFCNHCLSQDYLDRELRRLTKDMDNVIVAHQRQADHDEIS